MCHQVNYINCHATSTLVGDIAEVNAIRKVFTNTEGIAMNATKSMIGHCLGAAGGMEAIATIQAMLTGWVHPSINQVRLCNPLARLCLDMPCLAEHRVGHTLAMWQSLTLRMCAARD